MDTIKELNEINLDQIVKNHGPYTPSPLAWEDHVLYFLLLDRFSDGKENLFKDIDEKLVKTGVTAPYSKEDNGNAVKNESSAEHWRKAGNLWCGGNFKGLMSKIGYLKRLGISAIWVSPIFKQVDCFDTYHGYGIQNFLEIDSNFGTREELKEFVSTAHKHGIYVILDIIFNHAGDVFAYESKHLPYNQETVYKIIGYRDKSGEPNIPFKYPVSDAEFPDGAVWPRELQHPETFSKKGEIGDWNEEPECLNGDFPHPEGLYTLRDIRLGEGDISNYRSSSALKHLAKIYSYWIAYADIDGYRIDTVKHMDKGATRFFASVIHEFAQSIGKENFYLIGEIASDREKAFKTVEETGLDAALGINDIPEKLENVAKGFADPDEYFNLFRHSFEIGKDSHAWFRDKVVTLFDDHDKVKKETRTRFCSSDNGDKLITGALALNILTAGIPCIYYGTEQFFDGADDNDSFIRECMFGGEFGAFKSKNRHFFTEEHNLFKHIAKIIELRKNNIALRRGRQYLRKISSDGNYFDYPEVSGNKKSSIVAWSRIFNNKEVLIAINTDPHNSQSAWVTIDNYGIHFAYKNLVCLFSTDSTQISKQFIIENKNGKAVNISVPPGGVCIFQ